MSDIKIRKAAREDCPRLMELIRELAAYEKAPDQVVASLEHFVDSGFGDKPVWYAFVAEVEDVVIGFAMYYVRYSTWKGQRMYLEDLIVTEAMRGKGVGRILFDALIEEATAKKFSGIAWQVLEWNAPAINFYKKYEDVRFDTEWTNCSMELVHQADESPVH